MAEMTAQEAIHELREVLEADAYGPRVLTFENIEALDFAIRAIEQVERLKAESDQFRRAVEVAQVFQSGGELADKLPLGASCVIDGFKWLLAEREQQAQEIAALRVHSCERWQADAIWCRVCGDFLRDLHARVEAAQEQP